MCSDFNFIFLIFIFFWKAKIILLDWIVAVKSVNEFVNEHKNEWIWTYAMVYRRVHNIVWCNTNSARYGARLCSELLMYSFNRFIFLCCEILNQKMCWVFVNLCWWNSINNFVANSMEKKIHLVHHLFIQQINLGTVAFTASIEASVSHNFKPKIWNFQSNDRLDIRLFRHMQDEYSGA